MTPDPKKTIHLDIEFDGSPRSLAQIATILDKTRIKIISSFSHRSLQRNSTRWGIIADTTPSPYGLQEIQATLAQLPEIYNVTITTATQGRFICKVPPFPETTSFAPPY